MISLIAGALYFALFHGPHNRSLRLLSGLGLAVALLGLLLASFVEVADVEHTSSVAERVTDAGAAFVFARGEGSFNSRFGVYEASIAGFLERPFFGWGTERDVEGLALPAGSHSEYIAALYRQGLFGLFAFVGLLWSVWRATRPIHGDEARKPWGKFLRYGRWFYATALINSLLNDPAVDTSTFVLLWLFIALLIATRQQMIREDNHALVNG